MNALNTIPERSEATPAARIPQRRARRSLFVLGAVLVGISPLLLLEIGLRLFDLGGPADQSDPLAGFNQNVPLFERHGDVYRTSRARQPHIAAQEFPAQKPRNGFRIFCFGGSTVYGHPYLADTAFPKWLELELAGSDPSRAYQAINCGGVSYASYRIVPIAKEVLRYEPDLIVLATGHNEFLEDRTYAALKSRSVLWAWIQDKAYSLRLVVLARGWLNHGRPPAAAAPGRGDDQGPINTRLDSGSGYASYRRDDAWHQNVIAQYDESVRGIVAACQAAHVPILLVRLGSNLRDCPPFKSEHRAGLAPEPEADWQAAFDLATATEKSDPSRALQYYEQAAAIDGEHALLSFRIARVLDRTGLKKEALSWYRRARDDDICPLRISAPLEQTLTRIARDTKTPLVDAATLLAARSPDRIPGNDWYVDHVHPTIGGHQMIARALAAQMREIGLLKRSATWPAAKRLETYTQHFADLPPTYFANGKRWVGWLDQWAQRQRLASEAIPNDAPGYARLCFLRLDLGDEAAAWAALHEALKRNPGVAALIREHAIELAAEGRADKAAALLRQLN